MAEVVENLKHSQKQTSRPKSKFITDQRFRSPEPYFKMSKSDWRPTQSEVRFKFNYAETKESRTFPLNKADSFSGETSGNFLLWGQGRTPTRRHRVRVVKRKSYRWEIPRKKLDHPHPDKTSVVLSWFIEMLTVWIISKPQHSFQLTFGFDQIHLSSDEHSWWRNPHYRFSPYSSPKSTGNDGPLIEIELHSSPIDCLSSSNRILSPSSSQILRDERDKVELVGRVV